jgi:hypothetical protein
MKLVLAPQHFVKAQDLTSNYTTPVINALEEDIVGIQLNYTGSPVGAFAVQGSIDYQTDPSSGNVVNPGNWANLFVMVDGSPVSTIPIPAATSPILIDLQSGSIPSIRVVYIATSGDGTLDGYVTCKRIGD